MQSNNNFLGVLSRGLPRYFFWNLPAGRQVWNLELGTWCLVLGFWFLISLPLKK